MASKRGKDSPNISPERSSPPPEGSKGKKSNSKKQAGTAPEAKSSKSSLLRDSYHIGSVSSLEAMEPKVLLFQNRKLAERLEHYQVTTEELRKRSEQLQERLSATDAEIFIINRHTKSLEENVRILLKRFETDEPTDGDSETPRSPLTSFINQLSTLDEEELDKNLSGRVQEMLNLIGKLVQVYDTVSNQSRSVLEKIKNGEAVDDDCKSQITQLLKKNEALEKQALSMQQKCYAASTKAAKATDQIIELETERDEQKNRAAELEWSLDKEQVRREKVEHMVVEIREKLKTCEAQLATQQQRKEGQAVEENVVLATPSVSQTKMGEMVTDLEEQKTLAANRLQEIEKLHAEKVALTLEVEELKLHVLSPPDDLVEKSAKYKSLQTHFSVLYLEHEKVKEYYKTAKEAVNTLRTSYLQQLKEAQRHEEDGSQSLQTFLSNLQTATNAARRDYQMLRIEYEQEHASRETSGTNKDYDKLFKSVMQNNSSLEREVTRLRKCVQNLKTDLAKYQSRDLNRGQVRNPGSMSPDKRNPPEGEVGKRESSGTEGASTPKVSSHGPPDSTEDMKELKKQLKDKTKEYDELKLLYDMTRQASKVNRELVDVMASEKKLREENIELKKQVTSLETRSQAAETELKSSSTELQTLRSRSKQLEERSLELEKERDKEKSDRQRSGPDEALVVRIKVLEDALFKANKTAASHAAQEEALYSEMDVTGQALEDLQNQNKQLIDQLKERDNTNLKWMADNIRNNQIIKTLRDEKSAQDVRYRTLQECIGKYEAQLKLAEDRTKLMEEANCLLEENQKSSDYLTESWKRKAFDQTKETCDLRLKLEQLEKELRFLRTVHADKLKTYEGDVFKSKRFIEENAELKRKLDRAKLIEVTGSSEEILKEDIREYKELLNCNSCKAARKDTVLTKCYHVFCYSCISKRYETRQRRCPQCSTQFGANDYHRLYLT
ncbi:E3 ubiquitin-protein ligase Bre1 [Hypsibius exemplaris]|uniref:E3 ubiquitin protein ligase n=1 Tax=Hypsibius exemplaris TaxID=2072580 RepID=A0A1W0XCY4_HYPEX|nr:E3 ubiquitin-protein ligase Bre1 [Hypsibius exemplaris]